MSKSFNVLGAVDKPVIIMYLALVIIGLMNIYGASYSEEQTSIFDLSIAPVSKSFGLVSVLSWQYVFFSPVKACIVPWLIGSTV